MKHHPFETEADLCAAFIEWAKPQGWTAYAETEGWDILLVDGDGTQIGIQAKLRLNLHVLAQALEDAWAAYRETGPDFRAVLIPWYGLSTSFGALGLTVISYRGDLHSPRTTDRNAFTPSLSDKWCQWHYWNPANRHPLPEYVPDVVAGASAPSQLTKWKIGALRIAATNELRGYVTKQDFKHHGIDPRRWSSPPAWMVPIEGAPGRYRVTMDFAKQHPQVYPQVRADIEKQLSKIEALA